MHTKSKHTCSKCAFNIYKGTHAYPWLLRYAPRSVDVHRRYGAAWLRTQRPSEMKDYEDEFGFRWTALLGLPYVDTIRIHTVEPFVRRECPRCTCASPPGVISSSLLTRTTLFDTALTYSLAR